MTGQASALEIVPVQSQIRPILDSLHVVNLDRHGTAAYFLQLTDRIGGELGPAQFPPVRTIAALGRRARIPPAMCWAAAFLGELATESARVKHVAVGRWRLRQPRWL